jgi:hypothetical protein
MAGATSPALRAADTAAPLDGWRPTDIVALFSAA